jgi:hypothetical protein
MKQHAVIASAAKQSQARAAGSASPPCLHNVGYGRPATRAWVVVWLTQSQRRFHIGTGSLLHFIQVDAAQIRQNLRDAWNF